MLHSFLKSRFKPALGRDGVALRVFCIHGVVFLLATVLYGLTLSANLTVAMDASWYLLHIVEGRPEFHAHHLLYEHFGSLVVAVLSRIWGHVDPLVALSMTNAVFGAGCVTVIFAIIYLRCRLSLVFASLCVIPITFSFGLWYYSTTVEVYIIGLFFLLISLFILSSEYLSPWHWILVGLFGGIATLFHQSYPLFGAVILTRLYLLRSPWRATFKAAGLCVGTAAITALIPYMTVVVLSPSITAENFLGWFLGYAVSEQSYWHGLGLSSLIKAVAGFSRAMIGGFFLFVVPELEPMASAVPGGSVEDHAFLARNLGAWASRMLVILSVCLAGLLILMAHRSFRVWRELEPRVKLPVLLSLAWLLSFGAFFVFWEPQIPEFWIAQVFCFWMVLLIPLGARPRRELSGSVAHYYPVAAAGILVFAVNWFGSIQFMQSTDNDFYRWRLSVIEQEGRQGDLALVAAPWPATNTISLLTDVQPIFIRLPELAPSTVSTARSAIDSRKKVFVVFENSDGDHGSDLDTILSQVGSEPAHVRELHEQGVVILEPVQPPR